MIHRRRRLIQWVFMVLFLGLLTATVWPLGRVFLGAFLLADPLIAMNSVVSGVVMWEMALALAVVASALLLGRVFCGYACPLGLLVELTGPKGPRSRRGRLPAPPEALEAVGAGPPVRPAGPSGGAPLRRSAARPEEDPWTDRLRRLPLLVLVACLGPLAFGSGVFLLFDPLALLTRTVTTLAYPLTDRALRLGGDVLYLVPPLRGVVDHVTATLTGRLVFAEPLSYGLQVLTLGTLVGLLALSFARPRFWCRYLCPLGALLGQAGRAAWYGRVVDAGACTGCLRCAAVCPMDAVREGGRATDTTRCQLGLECAEACPEGAIAFGRHPRPHVHDPSRRALLRTAGASMAVGFFIYTGLARAEARDLLVRPPGSGAEADFLARCTRCGQCMKVCPTNVLQPASPFAGLEGVYTPRMDFDHSFCEWSCNECGKVCPTRSIEPLTLEEKRATVIGRAYIERDRCLPWADNVGCIVCQELCPTPRKAIMLEDSTVTDPVRGRIELRRPVVVPELCIGCGICQFHCPVEREAAIVVSGGGDRARSAATAVSSGPAPRVPCAPTRPA